MRTFLGIVNFMNKFSPQVAMLCSPLCQLTHQHIEYVVKDEYCKKIHHSSEVNFKHDRNFHTLIQSQIQPYKWMFARRLGCSSYAKRETHQLCIMTLTKTEQNYQNLERKTLGNISGMEKFHYFLYSKEFT